MPTSAKKMQLETEKPPEKEPIIRLTVWTDTAFHFTLELPASAVRGLLDPDVPDAFIEVPVGALDEGRSTPGMVRSVKKTYLHTNRIARIDIHDEMPVFEPQKLGG